MILRKRRCAKQGVNRLYRLPSIGVVAFGHQFDSASEECADGWSDYWRGCSVRRIGRVFSDSTGCACMAFCDKAGRVWLEIEDDDFDVGGLLARSVGLLIPI